MRALKIILGSFIALAVIILGIGAFLPKDYRVERSTHISAAPQIVFDQVNSLKKWDAWSPWLARDKTIQNTFSGPEAGVGAAVQWTSENSGAGSQKITVSDPPKRIETALDFGDMGTANADWTFVPEGDGVKVTWGLSGTAGGPLGGYFAKMMDGWVGADYQDGLGRLKLHVEGLGSPATP